MKIIFLDIDGVLNNIPSHSDPATMNRKWSLRVAPECLAALDWLVQESGAQVVVVSAHRRGQSPAKWRKCFTELGAASVCVIGETPRLKSRLERGYEIDAWLKSNPELTSYAILDDDDDMAMHSARLVQTDRFHGLTLEDAHRVVSLLNVSL